MATAASNHGPEHCTSVALRAWLGVVAPITLRRAKLEVKKLGRPVANLLADCGGIEQFVQEFPEFVINDGYLQIAFTKVVVEPPLVQREIACCIDKWSPEDVNLYNCHSLNRILEPQFSELAKVNKKKREIHELRYTINNREREVREQREKLKKLKEKKIQLMTNEEHEQKLLEEQKLLMERLSQLEPHREKVEILQKQLAKLDKKIKGKETRKILMNDKIMEHEQYLVAKQEEIDEEAREHEELTQKLLNEHSDFNKRQLDILKIEASEKSAQTAAIIREVMFVLKQHIAAASDVDSKTNFLRTHKVLQVQLVELENSLADFHKEIDDRLVDVEAIARFPVKQVLSFDDFMLPTPLSVFLPKVKELEESDFQEIMKEIDEAELKAMLHPDEPKPGPSHSNRCTICLGSIWDEPTETLDCGHEYHRGCLREMRNNSIHHCPLCRRYEASKEDFPALN